MRVAGRAHGLRWLERALLALGVGCLTWYGSVVGRAAFYQAREKAALEQRLASRPLPGEEPSDTRALDRDARLLIGRLDIPRLDLSVVVMEGDDDRTLRVAIGHLPDTPLPWELGNAALAGHRDTFFRSLKDIRAGDEIRLATPHGEFRYVVQRIFIVDPEDVWILNPSPRASLTLITCFPFTYVGHAPQRFVVQAYRLPSDGSGLTQHIVKSNE